MTYPQIKGGGIGEDEINGFVADHETAKRIAERAPEMFGQASGPLGWPNAESKLAKLIETALTAARAESEVVLGAARATDSNLVRALDRAVVRTDSLAAKLARTRAALEVVLAWPPQSDEQVAAYRRAREALASSESEVAQSETPPTFAEVTRLNLARCNRWHANGIIDWSVTDWSNATAGELGEVCNAIKKLRRIEDGIANVSEPDRQLSERADAIAKIGEEIADTFLYLNLLACRLGIVLEKEVIAKFNATSEKYGFPERLGN